MSAEMKPLRAAGYVRVSTRVQEERYSPENQERAIRDYCEREGLELVMLERDAESGHNVTRKGYLRICEAGRGGAVGAVVVPRFDRWGRDGAEWHGRAAEFGRLGIIIISVEQGRDEPGIMRHVHVGMAEQESITISRRTRPGREAAARDGVHNGPTPYGYRRVVPDLPPVRGRLPKAVLLRDEATAPTVQRLFERYASGPPMTLRQLALWANAELGIAPPKRGGRWSNLVLGYLLRNPVYVGDVAYNRRPRGKHNWSALGPMTVERGKHTGLVSRELWDAVQARLDAGKLPNTRRSRRGGIALAAGLLRCRECGGRMTRILAGAAGNRESAYQCSDYKKGRRRCDGGYIRCGVAHGALLDQVKRLCWQRWNRAAVVRSLPPGEGAEEKAVLLRRRDRLRNLYKLHCEELADVEGYDAERAAEERAIGAEVFDKLRAVEAEVAKRGGEDGVNLDALEKLHTGLKNLQTDLQRAEGKGDEEKLRALVLPLVKEASIVQRWPIKRSTWAAAMVEWADDVVLLLQAGALSLAEEKPWPIP